MAKYEEETPEEEKGESRAEEAAETAGKDTEAKKKKKAKGTYSKGAVVAAQMAKAMSDRGMMGK